MCTAICEQQHALKKLFFTRVERSAIKYKNRNMKFEPMRGDGKDIWSFLFLNHCVVFCCYICAGLLFHTQIWYINKLADWPVGFSC